MALVNMKSLLKKAQIENYAVGSFSVSNMEMIQGILQAAEETNSPVILQIAEVRLKFSPLKFIAPMMVSAAEHAKVPVAVHFDHGLTIKAVKEALDFGFTSVMFDGSKYPYEDNVSKTCEVIRIAEEYGAAVEAEIGSVGGSEDGSENIAIHCTFPEQAVQFQNDTGVDALAVAIGNAHGNYLKTPDLRFDILQSINELLDVPLVLHGGTGISSDDFIRCYKNGIRKINIATATFDSVERTVREAYKNNEINGYYDLQNAESRGAYENAMKHIKIFGCSNKA